MNKAELKFLQKAMLFIPDYSNVVEIGSWTGGSAEQLAMGIKKWCPNTKLYCVDPFDMGYFKKTKGLKKKMDKLKENPLKLFKQRMKKYPHTLIRKMSHEASLDFQDKTVNFVFIDGNHEYNWVYKDIDTWWPKLRPGGIMCGHDYGKYGVTKAVKESFKHFVNPARSIWKTQK